nr:RagB/SusD family nutrient uptake outer membrane protein [Bacteroides sp.]
MKKQLIFSLLVGALALNSCSLDKYPETTLTDTGFWKSETDLRGACNRLYIDLPGFLSGNGHDMRSDEIVGTTPNDISAGSRGVPERSDDWSKPYSYINVCNNIIIKGEKAAVSESIKNRWLAEAYFFRAYYYFDLLKKYGGVPLILKVFDDTTDPDIKRGQDSREIVIQQCYKDLDFAATWLPDIDEVADNANWGRVSRSAALAMTTRIGLYEGTYIKYHSLPEGDSQNHLKKAIDAAEDMIYNEKRHELYPDFQKLFYFEGEGRQNKENILVKVYGPNGASNAIVMHNQASTKAMNASITRQMIDNFLYTDGLPKQKSPLYQADIRMNDAFENRDPRLDMTVFKYGEVAYKNVGFTPFDNVNYGGSGYPIKKGFLNSEFDTNGRETIDRIIIRYAEVLLSYAEALYEYNGDISDQKLDETVNLIRRRSGFTTRLSNAFVKTNSLNMLEEIRRERMVEFIDEYLHYDDIIRWKTAEDVLPKAILGILVNPDESAKTDKELNHRFTDTNGNYNDVKVYDQPRIYVIEEAASRSFNPARDYLYPIPSYEIATSGGNIKQNPEWK